MKVKEYIYYSDSRNVDRSRNHGSRHLNVSFGHTSNRVPLNSSDLMNSTVNCLSNYFANKLSTSTNADSTIFDMQHPSRSIPNDFNNLVPSTEIATATQRSHDLYQKCIRDLSV